MKLWVTPTRQQSDIPSPMTIDDKIGFFVEAVNGWYLNIADICINGRIDESGNQVEKAIKHSGFAVLAMVMSYFEMIAKYQAGYTGRQSKVYFRKGVLTVFDELNDHPESVVDDVITLLYDGVRNSLYHAASTSPRIIITGDIRFVIGLEDRLQPRLIINPHLLPGKLRKHLLNYESQLRDEANVQLRNNFEKRFDYQMVD